MDELSFIDIRCDQERMARLAKLIDQAALIHSARPSRYEPGHVFDLAVTGVCPALPGRVRLEVERFVGAGFAGQAYKTRLIGLELDQGPIPGLEEGLVYAVKIIVPPSRFSRMFRNAVYWLAFQGPFAAQVNPAAARTGVLWQKLLRRGAQLRFMDQGAAVDTYATFFEPGLRSFGEINEWVPGRNWRLEKDDDLFGRPFRGFRPGGGSPEYLAKKRFMAGLVDLFHEMGAPELARQYEWWSGKSQPNVLKRLDRGGGPAEGLTAVDFRAGLALLPFLPMSPVDLRLILEGYKRGAFTQFDRGDLEKLERYVDRRAGEFVDLRPALEELKRVDPEYRSSQPDLTRHRTRILFDRGLRAGIRAGLVQGWKALGLIDQAKAPKLLHSAGAFWLFYLAGLIPFLGRRLRRGWGDEVYGRHLKKLLTDWAYLKKSFLVFQTQGLIRWHLAGHLDPCGMDFFLRHPLLFGLVRIFPGMLPLPAKAMKFLVDWSYSRKILAELASHPIRFYHDRHYRHECLRCNIDEGYEEGLITGEERDLLYTRFRDPAIRNYLKGTYVHLATAPVTPLTYLALSVYSAWQAGADLGQSLASGLATFGLFNLIPVSPGSLVRGCYVIYLMIKDHSFKRYRLAAALAFCRYISYFSFPIQLMSSFPLLTRFTLARWATRWAGHVPVFGERGALLQHWAFDLVSNLPLTLARLVRGLRPKREARANGQRTWLRCMLTEKDQVFGQDGQDFIFTRRTALYGPKGRG